MQPKAQFDFPQTLGQKPSELPIRTSSLESQSQVASSLHASARYDSAGIWSQPGVPRSGFDEP